MLLPIKQLLKLPLVELLLAELPFIKLEPKLASVLIALTFVAAAFELIVELLPELIAAPSTSSIAVVVTASFASPCFAIAFASSELLVRFVHHHHHHLLLGRHLE